MSRKDIHQAPGTPQVLAMLYFGANIPSGGEVDAAAFGSYLEHITPHFPGFTVAVNTGYWKGQPETVRVLSILAPDTGAFRHQVRMFAEQYKTRFQQEAVAYAFVVADFTLDCWPYGPVKAYHKPGLGY